nr:acrosin-like [Cherax quadricarinatus]
MRVVGLGVWVFLHLVFLGMSAYLYLLWVQYWRYVDANTYQPLTTNYTAASRALHYKVREIEVRAGKPRFYARRQDPPQPPPPPPPPDPPTRPHPPPTSPPPRPSAGTTSSRP